ncbi:hypothetical protein ABE189_19145 [Bacillus subtilis]
MMNTDLLMVIATYAGLAIKIAELILRKKKDTGVLEKESHVPSNKD